MKAGELKFGTNVYAGFDQMFYLRDVSDEGKIVFGGDDNKWNFTEEATYDVTVDVATGALAGTAVETAPAPQEESLHPQVVAEKLPAFMEWLALRSDLDSLDGSTSAVTLMTIHAAKGLEFPAVFVAGMEEGIFPHANYEAEAAQLEEERRLAYVAITRARKRLYLTYASTRRTYGSVQANPVSRFVGEIPQEHVKAIGVGAAGSVGSWSLASVCSWKPNTTIMYNLSADDFLEQSNGALVVYERKDSSEVYNQFPVEFINRANSYERETVSYALTEDIKNFDSTRLSVKVMRF